MKTDLEQIKEIAIDYLNIKPVINKEFPFIVYHPFIANNPVPFIEKDKYTFLDVINNKSNFNKYIKQREKDINNANSITSILLMMNKPYHLLFFRLIKEYLSKEDYNYYLKDIWIDTEFPNADKNVTPTMSLNLFKHSDKNLLMSDDELEYIKHLPNEVTIYRGTYSKSNYNALSWTDDYKTAEWFARRFEGNIIVKSSINKNDILACFNGRNENELIVDFTKIKNIEIIKLKNIKI